MCLLSKDIVKSVFSDNFPLVKTNRELEALINANTCFDSSYVSSGCISNRKEKIDALWPIFKPYADKDFLNQIRLDFDQRCWEMYLANLFNGHFDISASNNNHGPDFILNKQICVEATVCNHGEGSDRVPEIRIADFTKGEHPIVQTIPEKEMILRITSAISEKLTQYSRWLGSISSINEQSPFVIAINMGSLGFPSPGDLPFILKPLFGIGHRQFQKDSDCLLDCGWSFRPTTVKKNGSQVNTCIFDDGQYAAISAILFSGTRVLDHPQTIGTDCIVVRNLNAKNPINPEIFSFLRVY